MEKQTVFKTTSYHRLFPVEPLAEKLVIVDGPGRNGKFLTGNLINGLERVEYISAPIIIDNLTALWALNLIEDHTAMVFLRLHWNNLIYEQWIGRHVNIRPTDTLSVTNAYEINEIMERIRHPDGWDVIKHQRDRKSIPAFVTHDAIPSIDLQIRAQPGLYAIYIERNPIDIVESWRHKKWISRIGKDALIMSPAVETGKGPVQYWAADWPEDLASLDPTSRLIHTVLKRCREYRDCIENFEPNIGERILTLSFECLVTQPIIELKKIAEFLDTKLRTDIEPILKRERVPRVLNEADRQHKLATLTSLGASDNAMDELREAARIHSEKWEH